MKPFFLLFGRQIPSYGVLCVACAVFAALLAVSRAKKCGVQKDDTLYVLLYCIIGAILGAKLLYLLTVIPQIVKVWPQVDNHVKFVIDLLSNSGLVFLGCLLGAIGFGALYIRRYKLPFGAVADLLAPSIALGHAFGRVGCFMAGCCYGVSVPWGVCFTQAVGAPNGVPLFPVQLAEAGLNLVLCGVLLLFDRRKKWAGQTMLLYVCCYSVLRFVLEFFRGDVVRGLLFGLSTSQYLSIALLLADLFLWARAARKQKNTPS